jgi:DNA repair exonuclease SbcCD nuclease subunit
MKYILLSDCHLCVDKPAGRLDSDMLQVGLNKLDYVFNYAYGNSISYVLQAGDFVDIKRSWELLSALTSFFEGWQKKGIKMLCVQGQHDSYFHDMSNQKTIMGVLINAGLVTRLNSTPVYSPDKIFAIYGASFGEDTPKPSHQYRSILVCHRQILMNKIYKQQEQYDYAPAFSEQHSEYDLILTGDAHQKYDFKLGGRHICNAGPMMRLEATDAMLNHMPGFYIFDSNKNKLSYEYIPAKKGSEVLSKSHIELQKIRKHNFDDFIDKVKAGDQNQSLDFNENLQVVIQQSKASEQVKYHIGEYLAKGERV